MHFLRDLFSSRIFLIAFSIVIGLTLHILTEDNREFTENQNSSHEGEKEITIHGNVKVGEEDPTQQKLIEPITKPLVLDEPAPQPEPTLEPEVVEIPQAPPVNFQSISHFNEIWGYLMIGEELKWHQNSPITDVGVFSFTIDHEGHLDGRAPYKAIAEVKKRGARAHLVISSSGQKSLLHFLLNKEYRIRDRFLNALLALPQKYRIDGLQMDIEGLRYEDGEAYRDLLRELKARLPEGLIFSVALPARKTVRNKDAYPYRKFAQLADRFFIMGYDQHWKGGPPGTVAGKEWLDEVTEYSLRQLPPNSVVMGFPLYGRLWQKTKVAQSTRHREMEKILDKTQIDLRYDSESAHSYRYTQQVEVEGWFDDASSLQVKIESAKALGSSKIGFWRLGQEDPRIWKVLAIGN